MKKWKQIAIAASALSIMTISAATPLVVLTKKASNNQQENINKPDFIENWEEYSKKATEPKDFIIFNNFDQKSTRQETIKPYEKLSDNPEEKYYSPIFNKIDKKTVLNDLYWFIAKSILINNNSSFKLHIDDLKINDANSLNDQFHIELTFSIFNPNNYNTNFTLWSTNKSLKEIDFNPYEIKQNKLIINSKAYPSFLKNKKDELYNLYANYYFKDVIWTIGDEQFNIPEFAFYYYSRTIKTVVENISLKKNYLEIANQANQELAKLTIDDFKKDVKTKIDTEINKYIPLIDPAQKILQELVKNESTKEFLKNSSSNIALLVKNILTISNPQLVDFTSLIESLLADKTLFEILNNETNKEIILELVENNINDPMVKQIIVDIVNQVPDNQQDFNEWFDEMKDSLGKFLPVEISNLLTSLKTEGILTFIINNANNFLPLISGLIPNGDEIITKIEPIIKTIKDNGGLNANVIDVLINIIKNKDQSGSYYLLELIKLFVPNKNLTDILSSMLFDNSNLTVKNMITTLNEIANPIGNNQQVINYADWFKSLKQEEIFDNNASYDQNNKHLNLSYTKKFTITSDLKYDMSNVLAVVPKTISLPGFSVQKSQLLTILPEIGFITNDYFCYGIKFDTNVNYDVVNENCKNVLSWKALSKEIYDVNLPQTVEYIYNSLPWWTRFAVGHSVISLFKTIFFHEYEQNKMFSPIRNDKLNKVVIEDYGYYQKTNNAIFVKEISPETIEKIRIKMKEMTKIISLDQEYKISSESPIAKTKIQNEFDPMSVINELLDLSAFTNSMNDLKIYINSQIILGPAKILSNKIPAITKNSINIQLPYNTYTNGGKMQNSWTFSFN